MNGWIRVKNTANRGPHCRRKLGLVPSHLNGAVSRMPRSVRLSTGLVPIPSGSMIGSFLVTVGGLLTDEYQNVLNREREPIPGIYATGNCCGRRFGPQYSTPIAGVSIGMAITLGREVGRTVANL